MITEVYYRQYIRDFNAACAGDGTGFGAFYDQYYEPYAVFEYIPNASKNAGRDITVAFWQGVHDIMEEKIQDHRTLVIGKTQVAVEAPIDFKCKKDLEWVGVKQRAGGIFRLMMSAFYDVSANGKFEYVRVYSIFHPAYQQGRLGSEPDKM